MSAPPCPVSPSVLPACVRLVSYTCSGGSWGYTGPRPSPPSPLGVQLPFRSSAPLAMGPSQARMTLGKVSPSPTC